MGLRKKIVQAIYQIRKVRNKLNHQLSAIEQKEKMLMERLVEAQKSGDLMRAKVYASEIANIRKLRSALMAFDIKLEQAELRLDTALTFGDAAFAVIPMAKDLKETIEQFRGIIPHIDEELESLVESFDELAAEGLGMDMIGGDVFIDHEAAKILEEAKAIASTKMKELVDLDGKEFANA
ncbi:hypothetical protein IPA_07085 [Ignicoccus pacificus DSM 13166]|uniref:Uncharacterized protein n=1 Tax=Ignicoccus pacificus DSM 13166 TaxID=940294 RepID=A0A977K9V1_9CREN|nr:hypothetical protein IPA_07085 [Ignicoccus pacificus DSM 13166]